MLGPTLPCSSAQAFSPAMVERAQGRERLRPRQGLSVLTFIATIVVFSGVPLLPGTGAEGVTSVSPACLASGRETKCTCSDPAAAASAAAASESKQSATISKDTNILSVNCGGSLQFAPTGEKDTMVCSATAEVLTGCNVDILELLSGEPKDVKWKQCEAQEEKSNPKCKALTLPEGNFPFVDQRLVVGCTATQSSVNKVCKIPVTLKARASVTDGQTVTCAYGADSNTSRQAVTLNPSKNSFTLVCGDKGTVLPTNYETKFCSSDPEKAKETCDGDYQSILPGFENGWWKKEISANSFSLSIPVEKFPKEQAKMVVACQLTKQNSGTQKAAEDEATSSVCTVDVTIEAGSPASLSLGSRRLCCLLAFAVTFVMARGV